MMPSYHRGLLAQDDFEVNGCCLLANAISDETLRHCCAKIDGLLQSDQLGILRSQSTAYGIRNLLQLWPEVLELARVPKVDEFIKRTIGSQAGVVRGLLFDKPPERGWTLPWHRDRTVAVDHAYLHQPLPHGLRHPTLKAGVLHATAPQWLLQKMITLRFSLDPMTNSNGPLVFLPGSHRDLSDENVASGDHEQDSDLHSLRETSSHQNIHVQHCQAGDLFVMRPLLAHSSLSCSPNTTLRRRVIHLEVCQPIEHFPWHQYLAI